VDAAECVGIMLELKGHQVQVVHDGFEAVEAARRDKPDIILLDIGLPGRNGYEVAEILRADPQFAQTKIIAVTGYGKDEDRQRSKAAGMDHHLTKPVAPEDLDHLLGTFAKA
jgi:CheY-like chemotaxis protein